MSWKPYVKPHQGLKTVVSTVPTYLYEKKHQFNTMLPDTTIKILDFYLTYLFNTIRIQQSDFTNIMEGNTLRTMNNLLHRAIYTDTIERANFVLEETMMTSLEDTYNKLVSHATFTQDYVLEFKHNKVEFIFNPYTYLNKIERAFEHPVTNKTMSAIARTVGILMSTYHAIPYYLIAETLRNRNMLSKRKQYTYWGDDNK